MASSNLSELTVTCSQCGSANMQPLGGREYRCKNCGAITVVSQEVEDRAAASSATSAPPAYPDHPGAVRAGVIAGTAARRFGLFRFILPAIVTVALIAHAANSCNTQDPSRRSAGNAGSASTPATGTGSASSVPPSQVALGPVTWSAASSGQGHYVGLFYNRSRVPVAVPTYTMSLYIKGVRISTADGVAPVSSVMPGEYVPLAFAFTAPPESPHIDVGTPDVVQEADPQTGKLSVLNKQLVRTEGETGYRMVGVVKNNGAPVDNATVLVMLFGAHNALLGYGTAKTRALRNGEQTLVDVAIPSDNVNPVTSYQYLVEATASAS